MRLTELFTQDIPIKTHKVVTAVIDAHRAHDWNELERIGDIFKRTPWFDHKRNKHYESLTTDEDELKKALANATYYDEYYIKRLWSRIEGAE